MLSFHPILVAAVIFTIYPIHGIKQQEVSAVSVSGDQVVLPDNFTIDLTMSKVIWSGKALGIFKHMGTVDFSNADLQITDGTVTGGTFVVDLNTITATDKNLNPKKGSKYEKLKQHLSSSEFFDVETYPNATFNLDTILLNRAIGLLTVRGRSQQEQVENIVISSEGGTFRIIGDLVFNRNAFDVCWDSRFKDGILADDIRLEIILIGN